MPKVLQVAYGSGQFTKFKSQFKRGFRKVVATRAGRLREWSQGELRLLFNVSLLMVTKDDGN